MPKKPKRRPGYALVAWQPEDVQFLKPEWTLKHCKLWLEDNQKYMQARLVEMGWTVMEDLLEYDEDPSDPDGKEFDYS